MNGTAQTCHKPLIMPQVMDGIEHAAEHFAALVQVMQIGAGEVLTGVAITGRIQRRLIVAMYRVADLDHSRLGKQVTVARIAAGHHAVEHVHAAAHTFYQILGFAYSHQVTGFFRRHVARQKIQHADHFFLRLADRQTTNRQPIKPDLAQPFQRAQPQLFVHTALNDAEQR